MAPCEDALALRRECGCSGSKKRGSALRGKACKSDQQSRAPIAGSTVLVLSPKILESLASEAPRQRKGSEGVPGVGFVPESSLDRRRWLMLFYLSALALLSDWICFSMSPIMHLVEQWYSGFHPSWLVTVFLGVNVFSSFFEPEVVGRFGLRFAVVLGAALMCLGCVVKAGLFGLIPEDSYYTQLAGTVLVGYAQPFFQCTPAMLAANWFGAEERTLATTVALNANQAGIAMAYIVGTTCLTTKQGLADYFTFFAWVSLALTIGVVFQFRGQPRVAPTPSAQAKRLGVAAAAATKALAAARLSSPAGSSSGGPLEAFPLADDPCSAAKGVVLGNSRMDSGGGSGCGFGWLCSSCNFSSGRGGRCCRGGRNASDSSSSDEREATEARLGPCCGVGVGAPTSYAKELKYLWGSRGFSHTVVAFTGVSVLANVVATFLDSVMYSLLPSNAAVGFVGAAFQVAFVGGSVVVSFVVDRRKAYFSAGLMCFAAAAFCLFGVMLAIMDAATVPAVLFVLLLGFFAGPIEPISAETAVEVSYPVDENAIMAVQQFFGNAFSSLAVPAFHALRDRDSSASDTYNRSLLFLLAFLVACMVYYSTFSAPLRRLHRDASGPDLIARCLSDGTDGGDGSRTTGKHREDAPRPVCQWFGDASAFPSTLEEEEGLLAGEEGGAVVTLWEAESGSGRGKAAGGPSDGQKGHRSRTLYASI